MRHAPASAGNDQLRFVEIQLAEGDEYKHSTALLYSVTALITYHVFLSLNKGTDFVMFMFSIALPKKQFIDTVQRFQIV